MVSLLTGFYLGLGAVALLVVLALARPTLARLGIHHGRQRPRQTALVVAGLMFGTIVLGASAISGDSTRESFRDSLVRDYQGNDLIGYNYAVKFGGYGAVPNDANVVEAVRNDAASQGKVIAGTAAIDGTVSAEDLATGLGGDEITVLGVDPATWAPVMGWEAESGTLPTSLSSWGPDDLLLDHRIADAWDAEVGDRIALYFAGTPVTRQNATTLDGNLDLAGTDPLTGQPTHGPNDVYTFHYDPHFGPDDVAKAWTFNLTADANPLAASTPVLTMEISNARGLLYRETGTHLEADVSPYNEAPFDIVVHADLAVQTPIHIQATATYSTLGDPTVIEGRLQGILSRGGQAMSYYVGPAVVVPLPRLQQVLGLPGAVTFAAWDLADDAPANDVAEALNDHRQAYGQMTFNAPKADLERQLEEIDLATSGFFLGLGSFTMLAGLMLVFVLLALLIEERKTMLGALRAIGAQRWDLTVLHMQEGGVYAALAAVAGLVGATALAGLVAQQMQKILEEEERFAAFHLVVEPSTVAGILGLGFLFTLGIITIAAYRGLRLHIPSALRGEEAPPRQRRRVLPFALMTLGLLLTLPAFLFDSATLKVLAPALACFGAGSFAARWVDRNLAVGVAATATVAYEAFTFTFITVDDAETAITVPVRAALIVIAAAIMVSYSKFVHDGVVRLAGARPTTGAIAQNAFGYLRQRPARAALTMAMLGTVLAVMTALGTIFATVAPVVADADGGFPVQGDTGVAFTDLRAAYADRPPRSGIDPFPSMEQYVVAPTLVQGMSFLEWPGEGSLSIAHGQGFAGQYTLVGVDDVLASALQYEAAELDPRFATLQDAFRAVAADKTLIIVAESLIVYDFSGEGMTREDPVKVGDRLGLGLSEATDRELTVVARVKSLGTALGFVASDALFLNDDSISAFFTVEYGTRLYAKPAPGVSPQELQKQLAAGFRPYSMDVVVVADLESEEAYVFGTIQALVSLFLGLGILVGMVSLALISVRNVRVRRGEIGILRATGAQTRHILALFAAENLYVTLGAILIGLGVGLLMAYNVLSLDEFATFHVDWASLSALYGVTLVGAALAAMIPAFTASRIPPAKAVRYVE